MRVPESWRRRPWLLVELALAGLLIASRVVAPTWHPYYLDFLFYLGIYWAFLALCPEPRVREGATVALTLFFLGVYFKGVLPNMLLVASLLPP